MNQAQFSQGWEASIKRANICGGEPSSVFSWCGEYFHWPEDVHVYSDLRVESVDESVELANILTCASKHHGTKLDPPLASTWYSQYWQYRCMVASSIRSYVALLLEWMVS